MATEATSKPHVRLSERLALPRPVSFWVTAAPLVLFLYASARRPPSQLATSARRHRCSAAAWR